MEIWKEVVGYEESYRVSNLGRVRSIDRVITARNGMERAHKGRVLSQGDNGKGYMNVGLWKDNKDKRFYVHRLVVEAFVGPIPEDMEVDHINRVRHDNRLENLQLLTPSENNQKKPEHLKGKGKNIAVEYEDGTTETYKSISACSRDINMSRDVIGKYLNNYDSNGRGWAWGTQRMKELGIREIYRID